MLYKIKWNKDREILGDIQLRFEKIDAAIIQAANKVHEERGGEC